MIFNDSHPNSQDDAATKDFILLRKHEKNENKDLRVNVLNYTV